MITNFEMVGIFHKEFGHPIFTEPQIDVFKTYDKIQFRLDRIEEEINELKNAQSEDNFLEIVDAICDIMYFIYGTFHILGINFDKQIESQNQLVQNIMKIFEESIFKNVLSEDIDTIIKKINEKPKEFDSPINYLDIFRFDAGRLSRQVTMLDQYFSLLIEACEDSDFDSVLVYLQKMEIQCRSLANILGVQNIDLCFKEVHRANMTKACLTEEIAQETVNDYINKKKELEQNLLLTKSEEEKQKLIKQCQVYEDPSYRQSELTGLWIVYDKATSKILKSIYKDEPNHSEILDIDNIKNKEKQNDN